MRTPQKAREIIDAVPDWAVSPFSIKLGEALGAETVRFVGGAVRDCLLGKPVADVDMATTHMPDEVVRLLDKSDFKVIPTGMAHGTVTVVMGDESREITTLRVDEETDGRHANVAFTDSWIEDAKRRDFTVNAIYMDLEGELYDPCGGLADIEARRIRFIGDAAMRIREDGLRILRFYRFSALYADDIDPDGQSACQALAPQVRALSAERIASELFKLLAAEDAAKPLLAMKQADIFSYIFEEGSAVDALIAQVLFERSVGRHASVLAKVWLLAGEAYGAVGIARLLKLSGVQKKQLLVLRAAIRDAESMEVRALRRLIYQYGSQAVRDAVLLRQQDKGLTEALECCDNWETLTFPVTGQDLLKCGFEPGMLLGDALKHLERQWLDSDFTLSKESLLALVE